MDNFRMIYKILKILEKSMAAEEFDKNLISDKTLELPYPHWCRLMEMLVNEGYITGVEVRYAMDCSHVKAALVRPSITLKGLEYLEENSIMRKIADAARGIIDIMPGI